MPLNLSLEFCEVCGAKLEGNHTKHKPECAFYIIEPGKPLDPNAPESRVLMVEWYERVLMQGVHTKGDRDRCVVILQRLLYARHVENDLGGNDVEFVLDRLTAAIEAYDAREKTRVQ
jgi:hypothetical protein